TAALADNAQFAGDQPHIAGEDGREIGVDDRRVAASNQLDQGGGFVARRNLREAERAGKFRGPPLVRGIFPGMHEDDCGRLDSVTSCRLELRPHRVEIEVRFHCAVYAYALRHLDNALVKLLRQDDFLGEDVRSGLVGYSQRVTKSLRDEED